MFRQLGILVTCAAISLTAAAPDPRSVIVVLGDSISEGYGVAPGQSFPDLLQRRFDKDGQRFRVANMGVSGDTSSGGVGRLDYALSLKPGILILELGGNDGLRGIPVARTKANLETIIQRSQKIGTKVLLAGMTLPPNYGADYIRSFENIYRDLAKTYKLPLIPFLMEDIRQQIGSRPGLMQRDGIHPSADGHELIASTVMRYLAPMLRSVRHT